MSKFACEAHARAQPEDLAEARSSWVRRSSKSVIGATSGTVAVAVHGRRPPHAARLRPSDGAISALVAVIDRLDVRPGDVLKRAAHREVAGQRIASRRA